MNGSLQRRLWVLLFSAATALGVWKYFPSSELDRRGFIAVAGNFPELPLQVSGDGTHASPWALGEIPTRPKSPLPPAPAIISLGDDAEGFFQASPPAPIDFSVILANFKRLGATKVATAAVLAWDAPDPIALAALEKSLSSFESLLMAAPLSRGAVPSPIPPAFRRASLPLAAIHGNASVLPAVNRIPISGIILGGDTTRAGFSILEADDDATDLFHPLMARWEDRVVFSFPLLIVLQQLNLPLDGVKVELGKSIHLGPAGPTLKIDEFGRIAISSQVSGLPQVAAQSLIDGGADLFPNPLPEIFILRDDQSAAEPATRAFSQSLASVMTSIATDQDPEPPRFYPRLPQDQELGLLGIFVAIMAIFSTRSHVLRLLMTLFFIGFCLAAQWFAFRDTSLWLPGMPILAAALVAGVVGTLFSKKAPSNSAVKIPPMPKIPVSSPQSAKLEIPILPALPSEKPIPKHSPDPP